MKWVSFCLVFLIGSESKAQTQVEWTQNVSWDGISHWSEYLIFSPKFTGPNAMLVPEVSTGKVKNDGGRYYGLAFGVLDEKGQTQGRPRVKLTSVEEMLALLD